MKNRVRTWIRRIGVEVSNILLLHSINKHHVRIWYCMSVHLFFLPSNSQVFFLHLLRYSLRLIFTKKQHIIHVITNVRFGGGGDMWDMISTSSVTRAAESSCSLSCKQAVREWACWCGRKYIYHMRVYQKKNLPSKYPCSRLVSPPTCLVQLTDL